ncbi:MAG: phage tail tape measure protein [Pelagimonas sp.]|uniref:phage tail tape measure protein n=1 Tax=Pelagimonas sp. TaxID=2073170 RepID=UPI003D6AB233
MRTYTVRLSAQGKRELERYLESTGRKGQASLLRIHKASGPASKGLSKVSKSGQRASQALAGLGKQVPAIEGLARVLGATALATGIVRIGTSALSAAKDFQAAMKRVQAATKATDAEMVQLEAKARAVGASTQFRASEAASAIEMLAKNGLRYQAIMDGALDATMSLAGALGADLAPAADLVTDLMAQFGLRAGDLAKVTDLVTGSALNSKFGFDDMRLAIGQAGGVAGKFGVEIEDFLTALAATSSAFSSGSDAGTSFKTFLQRLTPQSKEASAAMKGLGLEFFDTSGEMKDLAQIAEELREGVSGLSEESRNASLGKIFGTDAIRTALLLADQGAEGVNRLKVAIEDVSAADQAAVRLQGLQGALKELASAWEDLQLTWADEGGLDVAETATRRLTDAIRFLSDNFVEINEVIERVAQALAVVLVGRGINSAIARAAAMRAAYIDLALSVQTVGTNSVVAARKMSALGVAGRLLTRSLGGPLGLIVSAGALAALAIDTDSARDAIDRAESAATKGKTALREYAEASRDAADRQDELGLAVDGVTAKVFNQNRAQLQGALSELKAAHEDLMAQIQGASHFDRSKAAYDVLGPLKANVLPTRNLFGDNVREVLEGLRDGNAELSESVEILSTFAGIGHEAKDMAREFKLSLDGSAESSVDAAQKMQRYAEQFDIFADQLKAIESADGPLNMQQAYLALAKAMESAAQMGDLMRSQAGKALRDLLVPAERTEQQILKNEAALIGTREELQRIAGMANAFKPVSDGAAEAQENVEKLGRSIGLVYQQYQSSRVQGDAIVAEAASSGLLPLIRGVESSRNKKLAYNVSLDHGRWTNGPQNLTGMTIKEIIALQTKMLSHMENRQLYGNGQGSSALGAYQITRRTLRDYLMPNLGLDGDELFDEKMQDRMAEALIRRRRGQGIQGLRNEWQGLNRVSSGEIAAAMQTTAVPTQDPENLERARLEQEKRIEAQSEEREAIDKLVEAGNERVAQLEFEQSLVGKSVEEQERLRLVFNSLTEAKRQGIDVDKVLTASGETLRATIERQASAYAKRQSQEVSRQKSASNSQSELEGLRGALDSSFDVLRRNPENVKEAFGAMVDYISQRLWKLALDPVFDYLANLLNNIIFGGGSGGGVLSFLFGGAKKSGGQVLAQSVTASQAVPGFANGGLQVSGRARGKIKGTGSTTSDNILLLGSRDEFMVQARAVDHYGAPFFEALNKMKLPKFANGGGMGSVRVPGGFGTGRSEPIPIQVIDQSHGVDVHAQEISDQSGGRLLQVILDERIAASVSKRGGATRRAMQSGFGLSATRPQR